MTEKVKLDDIKIDHFEYFLNKKQPTIPKESNEDTVVVKKQKAEKTESPEGPIKLPEMDNYQTVVSYDNQNIPVPTSLLVPKGDKYTLADYTRGVLSRQEVLGKIVKLMPKLPYDFLRQSFHYTLLEDMVLLCCTEASARRELLGTSILRSTSLKSNRFWQIVKELTGMRRTLHSMVSRYRSYWENLHPMELSKFFPYLRGKKWDHVVRLRKDKYDHLNYVDSIMKVFSRCRVRGSEHSEEEVTIEAPENIANNPPASNQNKSCRFGTFKIATQRKRKKKLEKPIPVPDIEVELQSSPEESLNEQLQGFSIAMRQGKCLTETTYFREKKIIEAMKKSGHFKYKQIIKEWSKKKMIFLQQLKANLLDEIELIEEQAQEIKIYEVEFGEQREDQYDEEEN